MEITFRVTSQDELYELRDLLARLNPPPYPKVEDLGFSLRTLNCLKGAGVRTAKDLASCTEQDLLHIQNLGSKSVLEIRAKLNEVGVKNKL